ncbi:MAG: galactokinase [Acidobacteriota bacterium]|nr:galactokinase [Acidobacteriota bacterium]
MTASELRAVQNHRERWGNETSVAFAPARVNLIGEHTDYTGGLVMPMAIGFRTLALLTPRSDNKAVFYSANFEQEAELDLNAIPLESHGEWYDYPAGVAWVLQQDGVALKGFNMTLSGDVPLGAGLSSSASIQVATLLALAGYLGLELPLERVATVCRRAENEYVGAKTGIMDQFVVAGGVENRAMMIDCRAMTYDLLPLPESIRVVICNSMVKHQLAGGEYGDRRDEVETGQAVIAQRRPGVELLRDATLADLEACADQMSEASLKRCRHIITENARVLAARQVLLAGDVVAFGNLMKQAHVSFRDDFGASCDEVDTLVEIANAIDGCLGARITGGGFGGCTVNLVEAGRAEEFVTAVKAGYKAATGIDADCFVCAPSDGALALAKKSLGAE